MSWIQQRTHRAMRHHKTGGAEHVQKKADERYEKYLSRLERQVELYTRRIKNPPLIHHGKAKR